MSKHRTFVERALAGEVLDLGTIDDEIDQWHSAPGSMSLPKWLGMTDAEYQLFVERPEALKIILMARRYGQDLHSLLKATDNAVALAARGASAAEATLVRDWLAKTGRL